MTSPKAPRAAESRIALFTALVVASAVALAVALASCGEGSLETMERSAEDPAVVAPSVLSFLEERQVRVDWPDDPRADEYVLEAASGSAASPAFSIVYRGHESGFLEEGCADQSLRLYRLVKLRGDRSFGPSEPVLGVGSATCRDALEPNDSEARAVGLGWEREANLYYYRAYGGQEAADVDWYWIDVPPRMVVYVVVVQTQPELVGRRSTWMRYATRGQVPVPVENEVPIAIANYAYAERRIRFEIAPYPPDFIGSGGPQGGSLIDYAIRIERIDSL